jgi:hypothetical protein
MGRRDLWSVSGGVGRWRCGLRVPAARWHRKDADGHASRAPSRGAAGSRQVRQSLRCLPFGHVSAGTRSSAFIHRRALGTILGPYLLTVYVPKRQAALHAGGRTRLAATILGPRRGQPGLYGRGRPCGRVSWASVGVLRWRTVVERLQCRASCRIDRNDKPHLTNASNNNSFR